MAEKELKEVKEKVNNLSEKKVGSWKIYTVVLYDSNTIRFCDS